MYYRVLMNRVDIMSRKILIIIRKWITITTYLQSVSDREK